jgi:hypothetical protein
VIGIGLRNCVIAGGVMLLALFVRNGLGPLTRNEFSRIHFPGQAVCEEVHRRWGSRVEQPLKIVGGSMFAAGCVGAYSETPVDVFGDVSLAANPWLDDETVRREGGILVWDIDRIGPTPPQDWPSRFPNSQTMEPFACPAEGLASDRMARVGMLFIRPGGSVAGRPVRYPSQAGLGTTDRLVR